MGMPVALVWMLALGEIAAGLLLIAGAFGKGGYGRCDRTGACRERL